MKLNKPFRIVLSIFVAVTMLTASTVSAFCSVGSSTVLREDPTEANNIILEQSFKTEGLDIRKELRKATDRVTPELMSKAAKDYRNLESVGLSGKALSIDHINADNEIVYALKINKEITDYVTIEEQLTALIIDFYEANLHDTLEITDEGEYILNGVSITSESMMASDDHPILPNARYSQYASGPIKGTQSKYTKYARSYSDKNIALSQSIINTTSGVLITVIAKKLGLNDVGASLFSSLVQSMKSAAILYGPDSCSLSYKIDVWEYPQSNSTDRYYMHLGNWYIKKNFEGTPTLHKFFEYNYFS